MVKRGGEALPMLTYEELKESGKKPSAILTPDMRFAMDFAKKYMGKSLGIRGEHLQLIRLGRYMYQNGIDRYGEAITKLLDIALDHIGIDQEATEPRPAPAPKTEVEEEWTV